MKKLALFALIILATAFNASAIEPTKGIDFSMSILDNSSADYRSYSISYSGQNNSGVGVQHVELGGYIRNLFLLKINVYGDFSVKAAKSLPYSSTEILAVEYKYNDVILSFGSASLIKPTVEFERINANSIEIGYSF